MKKQSSEYLKLKRKTLISQIQRLETENKILMPQMSELNSQLIEKKKELQILSKQQHYLKRKLLKPVSEEKDLMHSIRFLEAEKENLSFSYQVAAEHINNNMTVLEEMIKELSFIKGEIGTLIVKMSMLEEEIPIKFRDAHNLKEKITGTIFRTIHELHNKIKSVEKQVKIDYYAKKTV
ncbi:Mad24 [Candidatus Magnetomoraceae bacterium gMMP-15]